MEGLCIKMVVIPKHFMLLRVTIRPLFPGHVLFLEDLGFLNRPKCPGFGCFLNPAPAEFLTIAACSHNMCFAPAIFMSTPLNILILYIILAHQGAAVCMQCIFE